MQHRILCLHSSGSNGGQWRQLRDTIGHRAAVMTPDLIGYGKDRFDLGDPLTIAREVESIATLLQASGEPVHLVGHSYGGAVATHLALWHPELVASLVVYEPVLFALLAERHRESSAFTEIEDLALSMMGQVDCEHGRRRAAREFVNYWAEGDAWQSMENRQRERFAALTPKIAAEFHALVGVGTSASEIAGLEMPVHLICGERTRRPARRVVDLFAAALPTARTDVLGGLNHLAPISHPARVNDLIIENLAAA